MNRIVTNIRAGWLFAFGIAAIIFNILWFRKGQGGYEAYIAVISSIATLGGLFFNFIEKATNKPLRPIIEMELKWTHGQRSAPIHTQRSPISEDGYLLPAQQGGIYWFKMMLRYDLIIRNNSRKDIYNLTILRNNIGLKLKFKTKHNPLEPIPSLGKIVLSFEYEIQAEMTHSDCEKILKEKITDEIKEIEFIAKYQDEDRNKFFFSRFNPPNQNAQINDKADLTDFSLIDLDFVQF